LEYEYFGFLLRMPFGDKIRFRFLLGISVIMYVPSGLIHACVAKASSWKRVRFPAAVAVDECIIVMKGLRYLYVVLYDETVAELLNEMVSN
jgi:hypothetical protein